MFSAWQAMEVFNILYRNCYNCELDCVESHHEIVEDFFVSALFSFKSE